MFEKNIIAIVKVFVVCLRLNTSDVSLSTFQTVYYIGAKVFKVL